LKQMKWMAGILLAKIPREGRNMLPLEAKGFLGKGRTILKLGSELLDAGRSVQVCVVNLDQNTPMNNNKQKIGYRDL
jgi:hypothetical protein